MNLKLCAAFALSSMLSLAAEAGPVVTAQSWLDGVRAERTPLPVAAKALRTNPDRSFPPSCLSYPLANTPRGDTLSRSITLGDVGSANNYKETIGVKVWRVACSGGKSALVIGFDRVTNLEFTFPAPDVPAPYVARTAQQGGDLPLRMSIEPNTYFTEVISHSLVGDGALVIETLPTSAFAFNLNQAFTLAIDTFYDNQVRRQTFVLPAYNAQAHPDGLQNMEIEGHLTGSWYDPAHAGEGIFFEVGERADGNRYVFFSWFTFGPDGRAYWIVGSKDIAAGVRTVTLAAKYLGNGGFAGGFDPANVTNRDWGNVTFTFPDCDNVRVQYTSTHAEAGVPTGDGTRIWTRLTGINGFLCQ